MRFLTITPRAQGISLVLLYVVVGALWVDAVPPFEAPDEPWHLAYAETLAGGRWPIAADTYEAHQPGGYYLGAAAILKALGTGPLPRSPANVFFPSAEAAHFHPPGESSGLLAVLRTLTGFLAASSVALAWATGRRLMPHAPEVAGLAGLTVALLPQFQHIGHSVSNDAAAVAVGGAFAYLGVRAAGTVDRAVMFGLPLATTLAVATKLTVWPAALTPVVALIAARRASTAGARRPVAALSAMAASAALAALAARLIAPDTANAAIADAFRRGSVLHREVLSADSLWGLGRSTLMSAWGRFGWLTVDLPTWLYIAAGVVVATGFVGTLTLLPRLPRAARTGTWAALAACAAAGAAWFRNLLADPQPQGRLMFGALVAAAVVVAVGYAGRSNRVPAALKVLPLAAVLVASNVAALGWALPRAFDPWRQAPPDVLLRTVRSNVEVAARLSGEGAHASQTFTTPGPASRIAVAVHRTTGRGAAEVSVTGPDGAPAGVTTVELAQVPLNSWVSVEVAAPPAGGAAGLAREPDVGAAEPVPAGRYEAHIRIVRGDGTVELWGASDDAYADGSMVDGPDRTDLSLAVIGP